MRSRLAVLFLAAAVLPALARAKDPYEKMAGKISDRAAPQLAEKKIAVLPFDYLDGRKSQAGPAIAEELANRFVDLGKLRVIERTQIQKVLGEIKLAATGVIDESTAKQLRGLGVEAVVTGTLEDRKKGKEVAINVKAIRTDTLEVIAVARAVVEKTWRDEEFAPSPAPVAAETEEEQQPVPQPAPQRFRAMPLTAKQPNGFFDFFLGAGGSSMDLRFENQVYPISQAELNFSGLSPSSFNSIEFDGLQTKSSVPLGFRVGGFGDVLGGDFEMSFYSHAMRAQSITFQENNLAAGTFTFGTEEYLKVFVFNLLSGDLFLRLPTGDTIIPYLGVGMGLTLNNVQSPQIQTLDSGTILARPLNETRPGFMFRVPVGLRVKVADNLGFFTEGRFVFNTFTFNRGISDEVDKVVLRGLQFLGGLSLFF